MLVFPIGTPAAFFYILARCSNRINPPDAETEAEALAKRAADVTLAPLHQLVAFYRPRAWYWEVVDLVRRIGVSSPRATCAPARTAPDPPADAQMGALVFVPGRRTRAIMGLTLSMILERLYTHTRPFVTDPLNSLSDTAVVLVLLVYAGGVMIVCR